jgi:molybdopterin molybdotransferase
MTGAPLPPGCDAVQRVEYTSIQGEFVSFDPIDRDANVIKRAENAKLGDLLLTPRLIAPKDIAILASSGYGRIPVRRALRVAVLSTGDEIMQAGTPLRPGTIYDSNGPALVSQAAQAGCQTEYLGIAPDEEGAITAIALTALQKADVLLLSGGVSMGEFDFVPTALANAGIESVFHTLAMKPGKPTFFGVRREAGATRFVFGLPGNPVSTFVNFAFLVRPLLYALYGIPEPIASVRGAMGKQVKRKSADRVEFLPARFDGSAIWPIEYGGSSMLSALASADGFIRLEIGETDVGEGSVRDLRLV